jgi:hypothetical protein
MSASCNSSPSVFPDDDNWQGFTSSLITTLPDMQSSSGSNVTSPPSQPSSTGSSGKFNSFSFVGTSLAGGGVRRSLLVMQPRSKLERLCLGLVGSNKFCTKDRLPGASSCGTTKHEAAKFDALQDHCYVKVNEIQAHCLPTLSIAGCSDSQVHALSERIYTDAKWGPIFDSIVSGVPPDWLPTAPVVLPQVQEDTAGPLSLQPLGLLSPTTQASNLFDSQPKLSFDSADSSVIQSELEGAARSSWRVQDVPPELLDHIDQVSTRLKKIKAAWSKPFRVVETGYKLIVADLSTMNANVRTMHSHLGNPVLSDNRGRTVWEVLEHLHGAFTGLASATSDLASGLEERMMVAINEHVEELGLPTDFSSFVEEWKSAQQHVDTRLVQLEDMLRVHTQRFTNIRPVLERLNHDVLSAIRVLNRSEPSCL